ncbi:MAG: hypothetical protein P4L31_07285 [Candidatus Babeliales bacterium]|nr:hypothetical protein [Candidatus Babeliales bacterium]
MSREIKPELKEAFEKLLNELAIEQIGSTFPISSIYFEAFFAIYQMGVEANSKEIDRLESAIRMVYQIIDHEDAEAICREALRQN